MVTIIGQSPILPVVFSVLFVITSGLQTFFDNTVKEPGEGFMAGCTDEHYTISWTGPRGPLTNETEPRVEFERYGTMLHFTKPTEKDSGNYTCSTKFDSKVVHVIIKVPLTFVDTPLVQTVTEFQKETILRCEVKGGIKPVITWSIDGNETQAPKYVTLGDGMMIVNVTARDAGVYTCKATESLTGAFKEKNIMLRVEHKPYPKHGTMWIKREPAWAFLGSTVNLSCEAIAEPPPKFEWRQPIKNHGKVFNDTYFSVLQVTIENSKVFGNYTCKVSNKFGSLDKTISLEPGEKPLPPEIVDQQAENSDLLDIGIMASNNPTGMMSPVGFVVQYRLVDPKKNQWKQQFFNISNKNSYMLRNLQPNSKYEVRVATKNVAGLSEFTNISRFFTLETVTANSTADNVGFLQNIFLIMLSISLFLNW